MWTVCQHYWPSRSVNGRLIQWPIQIASIVLGMTDAVPFRPAGVCVLSSDHYGQVLPNWEAGPFRLAGVCVLSSDHYGQVLPNWEAGPFRLAGVCLMGTVGRFYRFMLTGASRATFAATLHTHTYSLFPPPLPIN